LPDNASLNPDFADLLDENKRFKQDFKETLVYIKENVEDVVS